MSGLEALEQMLGRDHPDIKYLSQEHIALVLSKALAETYGEHPNDPVEFFSKYLLNHVSMQKKAIAVSQRLLLILFLVCRSGKSRDLQT
jgi:hypothetical protein